LISGRCALQHIELEIDAPKNPLKIVGDAAQIQQLLLNLSLNALDAMPSSGRLNIAVATQDSLLRIKVRDTGAGIQPAMLDQLFTPFSTTKPNGVGLGLGICRRIAEAHHGILVGCNQPEGGAEFVLTIPIANANAIDPSKLSSIPASTNSTA
jgi:signal transduction histidine kinase